MPNKLIRFLASLSAAVIVCSLFLFLKPLHVSAAIAFDKDLGKSTNDSCTSTMSFTTTNAAAANSKIIVTTGAFSTSSTLSITVSGGGLTWHTDKSTNFGSDNGDQIAIASADAPSGLASSTTITATFSPASNGFCYIGGSSFTGISTGTTYDGTNQGTKSATGNSFWSGGSINTTDSNDLIFGFGIFDEVSSWPGTCTPNTNYTNIHCTWPANPSDTLSNDQYRIVNTTGSYTSGGFFASATPGGNAIGISVAYKAIDVAPNIPSLTAPASGVTGTSVKPTFNFNDTDPDGDDLQFTINLFQSNCTTSVTTYSMASGQTGWSPTFNGTAGAGKSYHSSTAGSGVSFTPSIALSAGTTYCWSVAAKDPSGTNTTITSGAQFFTTDSAPSAPNLLSPSNNQSGLKVQPVFQLSNTEADGDYLDYEIQICSTSNCSSVVRSICQVNDASTSCTGSQTGWASQSQQLGNAYQSGQTAVYNYQFNDLIPSTQYWWRAYAIDPGGSNSWSLASPIQSFTIESLSTNHDINIQGNTNVQGNVCFGAC